MNICFKTRVGENVVCVECLKVLETSNDSEKMTRLSCGMCEMPICSDQCQVIFIDHHVL